MYWSSPVFFGRYDNGLTSSKPFLVLLIAVFLVFSFASHAQANSKYAAFVYDANSGKVLFSRNADRHRFPASLTKMMTLYMVFDAIDAGKITLNSRLKVSKKAAAKPPSKLYLKAGSTIRVKDAILALVTKSANDVAAVVAENLGGSEANFARQMTRKARKLGMKSTTFANASGLPNPRQRTTARDMARLGLALRTNHPRSFRYFSTRSFKYGKTVYRNHNRLLGRIGGVNGIKTGYIRASGFNLVTNVEKDGRHLVAVVMGGRTGRSRNAHMADLINRYFKKASRSRSKNKAQPLLVASNQHSSSRERQTPPIPLINPTKITAIANAGKTPAPKSNPVIVAAETVTDTSIEQGSTGDGATALNQTTPKIIASSAHADSDKTAPEPQIADTPISPSKPKPSGWKIQISATPNLQAAKEMLEEASERGAPVLAKKTPYTETVKTGSATLYRVRFAGFTNQRSARQACQFMKRKKYDCIYLN